MTIDLHPNWAGWLLIVLRLIYVATVFMLHGQRRDDEWDARMAVTQTLVWLVVLYFAGAFSGGEP